MRTREAELTIGERVAYYRRRRGITQQLLADRVGRTSSWVEKIENGRAPLDRISVVRDVAQALEIPMRDLLPDDAADVHQSRDVGVPTLRDIVLSYRSANPRFAARDTEPSPANARQLHRTVDDVWRAYQDSRFGYAVMRLNEALPIAYVTQQQSGHHGEGARALAHLHHVAASVLVKLGDLDLAWICAERGDAEAAQIDDPIVRISLQRSIAHALLSKGQYRLAVEIVRDGIIDAGEMTTASGLSVVGTLMLVGATASARAGERTEAEAFLRHSERLADRLADDGNELWTSFGPTNVGIHRVTVAAELGDFERAAEIGTSLDVSRMPRERRVRHQLEVARALTRTGYDRESLAAVLDAERGAPEHVRRHFLTHQLVHGWIRTSRTRPALELVALARRLGHAA